MSGGKLNKFMSEGKTKLSEGKSKFKESRETGSWKTGMMAKTPMGNKQGMYILI